MTKAAHIQIDGAAAFRAKPGENLLRAALREGVGFPHECNSGGCGSCQFELLEGEVAELWETAPGLSPRARSRQVRLACQSGIVGDCRIKVRLNQQFVPARQATRQPAMLLSRNALTADMAEYAFGCTAVAEFLPGQYALLHLPDVEGERAYSMSNLANAEGIWKFIIKRSRNGRGTAVLAESLRLGDEVQLDGPYGFSYLRPNAVRDVVCIGGGSGLSPLKSILGAAVREPALAGRRLHLFYGGRTPADICIDRLLEGDAALRDRVEVISAVSDSADTVSWTGERGFIHEVLRRWLDSGRRAQDHEYYFCGPPPMTDAVQRLLMLERRVPAAQLHFDRFL